MSETLGYEMCCIQYRNLTRRSKVVLVRHAPQLAREADTRITARAGQIGETKVTSKQPLLNIPWNCLQSKRQKTQSDSTCRRIFHPQHTNPSTKMLQNTGGFVHHRHPSTRTIYFMKGHSLARPATEGKQLLDPDEVPPSLKPHLRGTTGPRLEPK